MSRAPSFVLAMLVVSCGARTLEAESNAESAVPPLRRVMEARDYGMCALRGGHPICRVNTGDGYEDESARFEPDIWDAVSVRVYDRNACAIHAAGGATCWAMRATKAERIEVAGARDVAFAAIQLVPHTYVVDGEGRIWARQNDGPFERWSDLTEVVALEPMEEPTICALTSAGEVYCWGSNRHGSAGDSDASHRDIDAPRRIDGLPPVVEIRGGFAHMYARDRDGSLWYWGGVTWPDVGARAYEKLGFADVTRS